MPVGLTEPHQLQIWDYGNVPQPMPEEPIATQSKPKYPDKVEV